MKATWNDLVNSVKVIRRAEIDVKKQWIVYRFSLKAISLSNIFLFKMLGKSEIEYFLNK